MIGPHTGLEINVFCPVVSQSFVVAVGSKQVVYHHHALLCPIVPLVAVAWTGIVWWDLSMLQFSGPVSRVQAERPEVLL